MYVSELRAEGIFAAFSLVTKKCEKWAKNGPFFQKSAILKFDFQKKKTITINFACDNYIFPKTRGNKNKQWTHSTPHKVLKVPCLQIKS